MENPMTNESSRPSRSRAARILRATLGLFLAAGCLLSMTVCTRSPESSPVMQPEAPSSSLFTMVEPCADVPVEEAVCTLPAE